MFVKAYLKVRMHNMNFRSPVGVPKPEDHFESGPELSHHHRVAGGQGAAEGDLVDKPQAEQVAHDLLAVGEHEELAEVPLLPHLPDVVPVEVAPVEAGPLRHPDRVVDLLELGGPLPVEDLQEMVGRAQVHAVEGVGGSHQKHRQLVVARRQADWDIVTILIIRELLSAFPAPPPLLILPRYSGWESCVTFPEDRTSSRGFVTILVIPSTCTVWAGMVRRMTLDTCKNIFSCRRMVESI